MAITQISDKKQVKLRREKTVPLEHAEGDANFTQLENAIDDISNIINSLGLLDNIPTMIDEKTDKIAADLSNTSDDLSRRTQAAIDKINQSTAAITEIKRVSDVTHRQLTYASSVYTNEFSEYDERLLYGIIDTAVKRLRETLQADINGVRGSLHKVATTGNVEDTNGQLDFFSRLSNIPRWIRETHDDSGFLYIRSPDATQFRIGETFFDMFNDKGEVSFRVNSLTGLIETGSIDQAAVRNLGKVARDNSYNSLDDKPALGDSAHRNVFDTGDVNAIPWDGDRLVTVSVTRALKDFTQNLKDSLKPIAFSNNINDSNGVLDKGHGGRGRSDNNYDGQWFYANGGGLTNTGFVLGNSLTNKISTGEDDGYDLNRSSNVNIDTWFGVGIRSSINSYRTSWKHDSRSGSTYQRGNIILDGESGERYLNCNSNWINVSAPSANVRVGYGNFEFYNDGGKKFFVNGDGNGWLSGNFQAQRGKFNDSVDITYAIELYGDTPAIDFHYGNSSEDYTSRLIATSADRLELSSHFTVQRDLTVNGVINGGGLGRASRVDVFDKETLSIGDIPYGQSQVPSSGALRICMDNLSAFWGKYVFDTRDAWGFGGASNEITTTNTMAAVRNDLQNQINDRITEVRFVRLYETLWQGNTKYGAGDGEIVGWVQIGGEVDGDHDYLGVYRLQMWKNGSWQTAHRV